MKQEDANKLLTLLYNHYGYLGENFTLEDWDKIISYNKYMVIEEPGYCTPEIVKKAMSYSGPVYNDSISFVDNMQGLINGGKDKWIEDYEYCCNLNSDIKCKKGCTETHTCNGCSHEWCRCAIPDGHVHVYLKNGIYWDGIIRGCDFCMPEAPIFMPHLRKELLLFCPYPDLITEDSLNRVDKALNHCHNPISPSGVSSPTP